MAVHQAIHGNIWGQFRIQVRIFEIVGYLHKNEKPVDGNEALRRVAGENGGAIKEEDEAYILKYRVQLPRELQGYKLVTGRRHPGNRRYISEIYFRGNQWCQFWRDLDKDDYDEKTFVLRRVA